MKPTAPLKIIANSIILMSPLGVRLVTLCNYLLNKLVQERAVSDVDIARNFPEGLGNAVG